MNELSTINGLTVMSETQLGNLTVESPSMASLTSIFSASVNKVSGCLISSEDRNNEWSGS